MTDPTGYSDMLADVQRIIAPTISHVIEFQAELIERIGLFLKLETEQEYHKGIFVGKNRSSEQDLDELVLRVILGNPHNAPTEFDPRPLSEIVRSSACNDPDEMEDAADLLEASIARIRVEAAALRSA